ncbi:glycine cleavage system H protein [Actinomycetes bacterium]|nr:glycine cleavage system H protein [Actinomycetes bacterium]
MSTSDLLFSTDHEWVLIKGLIARIGITDFAQDALGDVVFVQPATLGQKLGAGDSFSEVESTKSVSDIYAPLGGVVVTVNEALDADPGLVNTDPYGQGWICELEITPDADTSHLMTGDAYAIFVAG